MNNEARILWEKMPFRVQTFPEIPTDKGRVDLHGFATLERLEFDTKSNSLSLCFSESEVGELRIGMLSVKSVKMIFKNVRDYILRERDDMTPYWCDGITEDMTLVESKDYKQMEFSFNGGRTLLVSAEDAVIEYS